MSASYDYADSPEYAVKGPRGFDTPQMAGAIVVGALLFLIAVRRGFRGVNVGGVGVSVR